MRRNFAWENIFPVRFNFDGEDKQTDSQRVRSCLRREMDNWDHFHIGRLNWVVYAFSGDFFLLFDSHEKNSSEQRLRQRQHTAYSIRPVYCTRKFATYVNDWDVCVSVCVGCSILPKIQFAFSFVPLGFMCAQFLAISSTRSSERVEWSESLSSVWIFFLFCCSSPSYFSWS